MSMWSQRCQRGRALLAAAVLAASASATAAAAVPVPCCAKFYGVSGTCAASACPNKFATAAECKAGCTAGDDECESACDTWICRDSVRADGTVETGKIDCIGWGGLADGAGLVCLAPLGTAIKMSDNNGVGCPGYTGAITGKVACERSITTDFGPPEVTEQLDETACNAVGCCTWTGSECESAVGENVCSATTSPDCKEAKTCVVCGSGDTDSECVHCSSDTYMCNSKDCKFEGGSCVPGNGLMTATVSKASEFFLTLSVTLPYTKDQFDKSKQDKYKTAVANAAGTVAANVEIVKITDARRRAGKVDVETKVLAADQEGLDFLKSTLTSCHDDGTAKCKIDKALVNEGLEKSTSAAETTPTPTMEVGNMCRADADFRPNVTLDDEQDITCDFASAFALFSFVSESSDSSDSSDTTKLTWSDMTCDDLAKNPSAALMLMQFGSTCCGSLDKTRCLDGSNMCKADADFRPNATAYEEGPTCTQVSQYGLATAGMMSPYVSKLAWSNVTCDDLAKDPSAAGLMRQFGSTCCGSLDKTRCLDGSNMCRADADFRPDVTVWKDEGANITCADFSDYSLAQMGLMKWSDVSDNKCAAVAETEIEVYEPGDHPLPVLHAFGHQCCGGLEKTRCLEGSNMCKVAADFKPDASVVWPFDDGTHSISCSFISGDQLFQLGQATWQGNATDKACAAAGLGMRRARPKARRNGEQVCENRGFSETECLAIGCCQWDDNQCFSAVGDGPCEVEDKSDDDDGLFWLLAGMAAGEECCGGRNQTRCIVPDSATMCKDDADFMPNNASGVTVDGKDIKCFMADAYALSRFTGKRMEMARLTRLYTHVCVCVLC